MSGISISSFCVLAHNGGFPGNKTPINVHFYFLETDGEGFFSLSFEDSAGPREFFTIKESELKLPGIDRFVLDVYTEGKRKLLLSFYTHDQFAILSNQDDSCAMILCREDDFHSVNLNKIAHCLSKEYRPISDYEIVPHDIPKVPFMTRCLRITRNVISYLKNPFA